MKYEPYLIQLSSLEKVFLDEDVTQKTEVYGITALKGERVSYQVFYKLKDSKCTVPVSVLCDPRIRVILRRTDNVPVVIPALQTLRDEWFLRDRPGLYPDVLTPIEDSIDVTMECAHSLYVTCELPDDLPAGNYPVDLRFTFGPINFSSARRAISRRTGSKLETVIASGVSSMIRSTPVMVSRVRILRPSRPMMRPFISSLGSGTTETVASAA